MKLKYLIPFLGVYLVYKDTPMTYDEYATKSLQGDEHFAVTCAS